MSFLRNTKQLLSHHREASFLSLLVQVIFVVYRGSCETVILDHHSRYDQSWDWLTTYELASGSGWSRSSQTGEYLVCDLAETTTKSTNSWLISNFIDLQGAASVSVKVEFTARQCDLPSFPFCRQSFKIFSFQRDNMINAGVQKTMIETGQFTLAGEVNASDVWNLGQRRITNRVSLEFGIQSKGLYLGFQDVGGCIALGKVQLSSNFCPGQIYGGVSYNRTPSPPSGNSTKVYGKCSLNSESLHHVNSLYMECLSNGSWSKPASALTCLCKPGYQLTPKGCQECPSGTYKGSLSNSACSVCPANSNSYNSRHHCECNSGYYRGQTDNKEGKCTAPPSSPRNLSVVFQDQSVIVVAWLAPSDSGGRDDVVYDVNCFQCDASPDCSYRKPCNGKLEFWPMKFNNPHTHVTVTALQPNTSYFLRITAENGVSHLYGPNTNRSAEIQFGTKISAKMLLDKTYVDDATAVLAWHAVENPHEFSTYDRYEISCFKCEDDEDSVRHQCTVTCGDRVRFWPGREGLNDNHVTVSELESSTLYKFVLYAWKYQTALASVLVQTSESPAKSQEQFFNVPTIIAMVLAGILFICAVVIFLVSLHLKRRWYATAKKQVTDRGAKDSPFSAENTENTIIMEEILQEFGHTISSNGSSTE